MKDSDRKKILVIRMSAMGDVAMTVPVLKALIKQHPELDITLVSRPLFKPFFQDISQINFFSVDLKNRHKGLGGIIRLFNDLRKLNDFDLVADLHDVLRSKILRNLFRAVGKRVSSIDKGRAEKKELTKKENKKLEPLKTSFERYADVFREFGFDIKLENQLIKEKKSIPDSVLIFTGQKEHYWIGISPFAQHQGKFYPLEKMKEVIAALDARNNIKLFIFGGGKKEQELAENLEKEFRNVKSVIGTIKLNEELQLIANLDLMISMDSSNMHMASLVGTPVVSIWGATHPYAGFYGYGQNPDNIIQDSIECRPCSVFGNKPCFRNDYACLHNIEPTTVINKILQNLHENPIPNSTR